MSKTFSFKQFTVINNANDETTCGMPVSTDGILLGAWAYDSFIKFADKTTIGIKNTTRQWQAKHILDIGTGTGLLALMSAQQCPHAQITAIDIDKDAINTAQVNIQRSPWAHRVTLLQQDIETWRPDQRFDLIISNPPYFTSGVLAQNTHRAIARHFDKPRSQAWISAIANLLSKQGLACLILPIEPAKAMIQLAIKLGLAVEQICYVNSVPTKAARLMLFSLSWQSHQTRDKVRHTTEANEITIRDKHNRYTPEFVKLTKDFYLSM